MNEYFRTLAQRTATAVGTPWAFFAALLLIGLWVVLGPMFHYSDTWQLVVNTITTIVTFLMVFLIQNTQNRDSRVFHLKLDELLRGVQKARTGFVDLEDVSDDEIKQIEEEFRYLHEKYGDSLSALHRHVYERAHAIGGSGIRGNRHSKRSKQSD